MRKIEAKKLENEANLGKGQTANRNLQEPSADLPIQGYDSLAASATADPKPQNTKHWPLIHKTKPPLPKTLLETRLGKAVSVVSQSQKSTGL